MTTNSLTRYDEIDFIKGVLMLLVYLNHSVLYFPIDFREAYAGCKAITNFTDSFYMPCFFVVSGFLFYSSNKGFGTTMKDKLKRLAIPYLFICGISLAAKLMAPSLAYVSKANYYDYLKYYLLDGGDRWFVYVLFGVFLIISPLKKYICKSMFTILLALLLIYTIVDSSSSECCLTGARDWRQVVYKNLWGGVILRFLNYSRYFVIGFLIKKHYAQVREVLLDRWWILAIVFVVYNIVLSNIFESIFFSLILPIVGSLCLFAICAKICSTDANTNIKRWIKLVGKYSLQFYMLNGCILAPARFLVVNKLEILNPWLVVPLMFVVQLCIASCLIWFCGKLKVTRMLLGY